MTKFSPGWRHLVAGRLLPCHWATPRPEQRGSTTVGGRIVILFVLLRKVTIPTLERGFDFLFLGGCLVRIVHGILVENTHMAIPK
ncbi:hypothetical protein B0T17DRAFT_132509 [Bombardia bombarda]|uniref:Uncharacterized protein n=1 Tax=Bombardia bombarda TaxID=252184 RepID=A0AA39W3S2_9PEZI|nr:hypothetical protein B0T17DRAFT_132509 [Bombardia bombarda]